jgi:arylsulfatase A-like enzyme
MRWLRLAAICLFACSPLLSQSKNQLKPNVVLIITDDLGWSDVGSYGSKDTKTPNIDSLARDGVKFSDFYANAVMCSPTRAGLITGRYQQRYGIEFALPGEAEADRGLPARGYSLPQLLKNNGYATALLGKWHLGYKQDQSPQAHGFDYFFGLKSGYHDYYQHTGGDGKPDLWENEKQIQVTGYSTDLITEKASKFIGQNAEHPFFIDVAFNAPHWPYQVPDHPSVAPGNARHVLAFEKGAGTRADYVAMVERIDRGVGEILRVLKEKGLAENTIVIFTNDNGGEWLSSNAPLFNRKITVWEGGIRVPAIIRWPHHVPAGKVTPQVGITMDLTASIVAATGSTPLIDPKQEGINLFPILEGKQPVVSRTLFWRMIVGLRNQKAVRDGDWKMVIDNTHVMVFNVREDISERNDLTNQRQDVAQRLRPLLAAWEKDVDAEAKANGITPMPKRPAD